MILRNIWQSLLKRPVPSNRSFFDLGGHSLLVLQLFERMKEQLPEYEFQIADLFRLPTIERFTAELLRGKDHIHIEEQSKPQSQQKSGQSPDIQQKDTSSMLDLLQRIQRGEVSPEEALRLL
jgi:hypothetical protein